MTHYLDAAADQAHLDPVTVTRPIRVASVPSSHVYVRHLTPSADPEPAIVRLADPDPDDSRRSAVSRWWPPVMLNPDWVVDHADEFDVFHLQFGFDARSPDELRALTRALRRAGKPFVYTVHDLRNPHHESRREHDAQLDVLIPAADALITLTTGAASEIRRRWGRPVHVIPHPHVVDVETIRRAVDARSRSTEASFRVGVHVKSLRASMNPLPVIETLIRTVREAPGVVLQVDGHSDVLLPGGHRYEPELARFVRHADARGDLELRVHDFFTDVELWDYLSSLDVSVLPYRFGTHSGWLEACRDLGTAVIAPDCGYYREQGPVITYHHDESAFDAASLTEAVRLAVGQPRPDPVPVEDRLRQRQEIATAHTHLYRSLLG